VATFKMGPSVDFPRFVYLQQCDFVGYHLWNLCFVRLLRGTWGNYYCMCH